jgi:hypothetical protein
LWRSSWLASRAKLAILTSVLSSKVPSVVVEGASDTASDRCDETRTMFA